MIPGPFLSTLFPLIGPTVTQLSALSQTLRLLVAAVGVSTPLGTLVTSEKLASAGVASPEPGSGSLAMQAKLTSVACHCPSGAPGKQLPPIVGFVLSILITIVFAV